MSSAVKLGVCRCSVIRTVVFLLDLLPKIRPAAVLPQHQEIHPVDDLLAKRRELLRDARARRIRRTRTEVRVDVQRPSHLQQTPLGPFQALALFVPFGSPDGPREDGVGVHGGLEDCRRDSLTVCVDAAASDQFSAKAERARRRGEDVQDLHRFRHDFGADAVAGKEEDIVCFAHGEEGVF
jgi:hypothetical protein